MFIYIIYIVYIIIYIYMYTGNFIIPTDQVIFFRAVAQPPGDHGSVGGAAAWSELLLRHSTTSTMLLSFIFKKTYVLTHSTILFSENICFSFF